MQSTQSSKKAEIPLELWGGVECTCNRVGDDYIDQMELSRHSSRHGDFERFAQLGIRTLRVGLLWERYEERGSWRNHDALLHGVRRTGIRPIAGLVHHGSGPRHTSLLDPAFPEKLTSYAHAVAERYPFIDAYTPVNEPNTTARFSGMYGVWYPHHHSRRSYLLALLNQLKATVLSMEAIRRVNPDAQLIQTDDLGTITGTPELQPTWELLNLRQWLPFDLLCGHVNRDHPMFSYMRNEGITEKEIFWFMEHPCPPDIIGANYYVTSDRFLDHRIDLYPSNFRSSEGPFVDVEAVRIRESGITGFTSVLCEAWDRYQIPVAITEVHLGCETDEQIRWIATACRNAMQARRHGVNCLAVTVWALLGSFYWNQLVTAANGYYEPGVFDISSGEPVETDLANILRQIAAGDEPSHDALDCCGWWEHDSRVCFPPVSEDEQVAA